MLSGSSLRRIYAVGLLFGSFLAVEAVVPGWGVWLAIAVAGYYLLVTGGAEYISTIISKIVAPATKGSL